MKHILILFLLFSAFSVSAQEVHQELQETVRAEVTRILSEDTREIIGTDGEALVQDVEVRVLEGAREGEIVSFINDITPLAQGDAIYVNRLETIDGTEYYIMKDVNRHGALVLLGVIFAGSLIFFAGMHGVRALISLGLSVAILFGVLVPLLLHGYSPVLVSVGVAGPILALTLFLTHGFHSRTTIAFLGTFGAVVLTSLLATFFVDLARLTGLSSDAAIYLNFATFGALDFGGILLGSIIIGILGILDDVSITQASVVLELKRANPLFTMRELYARALRVGRDHIGSLVNTLSLAYVGAALPLILLMSKAGSDFALAINQEMVAVELVRIFVGSIGLILAVPLTTLIAGWWYARYPVEEGASLGHAHTHTH